MKFCQNCSKSFTFGKNDCCSIDCYLEILQSKLEVCFRNDNTHTQILS